MSILLEALRKSEKSQRPVEAPTIHVQQHAVPDSEPVRAGPLGLLLLVALLLIAWVVWRQYQPPAVGYQPPVTLPARPAGANRTPVPAVRGANSATDSGKVTRQTLNRQRTPVEIYRQVNGSKKSSGPNTSGSNTPKPLAADIAARINAGGAQAAPVKKPASKDQAIDRRLAPISYWELPDAVREEVPEMHFSVLVYANEPSDRFVLVDGKRLQQGDSYQQGLVVEEIRRDGVVFSYRLYQFLVER